MKSAPDRRREIAGTRSGMDGSPDADRGVMRPGMRRSQVRSQRRIRLAVAPRRIAIVGPLTLSRRRHGPDQQPVLRRGGAADERRRRRRAGRAARVRHPVPHIRPSASCGDLDVVKREEFEAVKEMARLAREENEALKARIAALEASWRQAAETSSPMPAVRRRLGPRSGRR